MDTTTPENLKRLAGMLILGSLTVGLLCISFIHPTVAHADMGSHASHKASSVTLNPCCDVGVDDHMELWKSTLVGIPQSLQDILTLFAVSLVVAFAFSEFFVTPRIDVNLFAVRYRQYTREHPDIALFDPFRLAFARGILHGKAF